MSSLSYVSLRCTDFVNDQVCNSQGAASLRFERSEGIKCGETEVDQVVSWDSESSEVAVPLFGIPGRYQHVSTVTVTLN